jgi:hypothetical protein
MALQPDTGPSVTLLETGDPRWRALLGEMRHDVYHLPEYLEFATRHQEPGRPVAVVVEQDAQRLLMPLIVRTIPDALGGGGQAADAVSPHGYPGPLVSAAPGPVSEAFVDRAATSLKEALRAHGIVSAFIRLHPLFPLPMGSLTRHGTVVDHGDAVAIDLALSADELWRQTRSDHRRGIHKARRLGLTVRVDDGWERLDDFVPIYLQSMDRLGAAPHWRLSRAYFADLHASLGGHMHLCVAEDGDRLAGGALLSEVDGVVEYHLAGTADSYIEFSPSKSIVHFARTWAKERGNRVLHLAGSLRRGDSLSYFKIGFSPLQAPVLSWRLICDAEAYEALGARWSRRSGSVADAPDGYFPTYRRPTDAPTQASADP